MPTPTSAIGHAAAVTTEDAEPAFWWLFLFTGVLWLIFALLVFQFDDTSVSAISILLGITCLGAAGLEALAIPASQGWWRAGRIALAVGFAIIGIVAFVHPGDSFRALSTVFAFYLLLRGLFEVVAAFLLRGVAEHWWVMLVAGLVQIGLAFWAAGDFGHKAFLLLVWVGVTALTQGLLQIVRAFELKPS